MKINIQGCLEDILIDNTELSDTEKSALSALINLLSISSYQELYDMAIANQEERLKILPCPIGTKVYRIAIVVNEGYPDPKIEPEMFLCDFKEEWADGYGKYIFLESEKGKALEKLVELQKKYEKYN